MGGFRRLTVKSSGTFAGKLSSLSSRLITFPACRRCTLRGIDGPVVIVGIAPGGDRFHLGGMTVSTVEARREFIFRVF